MTYKVLAASFALVLAPALGIAAGCDHDKQTFSCAQGSSFDPVSGTCTTDVTI
ncbi:hypothetical protein SAMN04488523_11317 [Sulfitobacter brevis]|uniref:Chitin binding Peritrophin-A domain-containing protein n=1 Tax=Sulfitobacter brevis TaxID=74348 RepID=A0A1I2EQR5_9RHOB|nr:adenylosuccinate lyase [Sulfitobacter brevis]SFE94977.1 hypothetical protein SAMN04488523_11317 [Sulfitobacter brevis]